MSLTDLSRMVTTTPDRSLAAIVQRRILGSYEIDPWGLDPDLVSVLAGGPLARLAVKVEGAGLVPDGPAVLAVAGPAALLGPVVVGLGSALGRPLRFTGVPDVALTNAVLHRLGGVQGHEADLRGLLRAGSLVVVPRSSLEDRALPAASATGAPVVPVSIAAGVPLRVDVGRPVPTRRRGRARELAEVLEAVEGGRPGSERPAHE